MVRVLFTGCFRYLNGWATDLLDQSYSIEYWQVVALRGRLSDTMALFLITCILMMITMMVVMIVMVMMMLMQMQMLMFMLVSCRLLRDARVCD